jgi:hypothetical protein
MVHDRVVMSLSMFIVVGHHKPFYTSHPASVRSSLMLSSHLHIGLQNGFLSVIRQTFVWIWVSSVHAACRAYLILDLIDFIIFDEVYKLRSSSLPHCVIFFILLSASSLSDPNLLLAILFSHRLNVCSSLHVGRQVSDQLHSGRIVSVFKYRLKIRSWNNVNV